MKVNTKLLSTASAILFLTGCGVTSQDKGLGDAASNVSGLAVDGYVMNAVVYVDTNENNVLDIWEPQAITDKSGYFTYNPLTEINYCEETLEAGILVHPNCLKMPAGYSKVLIRITKGYDITTNEPFTGTLSMRVSTASQSAAAPTIATPVTGLLAHMTDTQKADFFSHETGIDTDNATLDFLNFNDPATDATAPADDAERRALLSIGLNIHKVADIIAAILDAEFDQGLLDGDGATAAEGGFFGVASNIPGDASVYVYQAIAAGITTDDGLSSILGNVTLLEGVISNAFIKMNTVVSDYNATKTDVADHYISPTADGALFTAMATDLVVFSAMIDTVLNEDADVATVDDLKARMRAIDIVASLMRDKEASDVVARAVALAGNDTYIANLKEATFDIAGTRSRFIAAGVAGTLGGLDGDVSSFAGRSSLSDLFGDDTAGFGGSTTAGFDGKTLDMGDTDKSVGIAFTGDPVAEGEPAATSGTMTIDATFLDDSFAADKVDENGDPVLDENGDPVKEPLELDGTWEQIDEYTMVMNVEIAGATQPVIVKPTLTEDGEAAYYFDFGGEQQIWVP